MSRFCLAGISAGLFFFLPLFALAHDTNGPLFNQVSLQAIAEQDIDNDQLQVVLAVEQQGKAPAEIANAINREMQWALNKTKPLKDIEVSTGTYQTYPVYKDQVIVAWRASQQLQLKSKRITALSELVGELQQRLQVKQMSFSASQEARVKAENDLITQAMQAFKQRVAIVAGQMEEKNHRIVNLHVNTGGHPQPVMFAERTAMVRSMAMDTAPQTAAGTSTISVTVSGSVQFF